ncbi:exo-alpha-sialidase [Pseudactinotalea sp. HY160]|uniref:sialidase family protein n=1 Tax=Pseudactinotalea sp. HY160 TaxID=2654490 RepID=UPI00128DD535|nr:exo-alpha-sialidase [Pseudactinotalea sp. HY160]
MGEREAACWEPAPGRVVLAERGVGGYRQYRIPALAATATTTLCAFDGRHDFDDLPAPIDLLLRRSSDSGATWEEPKVVRRGTGHEGFGDPSLLADPATGRVFLFHSATERAGFFESGDGEDPADPMLQHADVSVSEDEGRTWRHERLTAPLRRSGNAVLDGERIAGMFAAAGAGCAITAGPHAGRLVQVYVLRIGGRIDVACAVSDDHGGSWRLGRPIGHGREAAPVELNESSVCMLADGSLLLHSRGPGHRLETRSRDGGETFGPVTAARDLPDSGTNGSVLAPAAGPELYASHTAGPDLRRGAQISRSDDRGHTWSAVRVLEPGSAGYTRLAELPDGRIGVVYEADGYQEIRFEAYAREELLDPRRTPRGAPVPAGATGWARANAGGVVVDLVLRSILPARPASPHEWSGTEPVHVIDLSEFAGIGAAVFKEIGRAPGAGDLQVLRTRAALDRNLGPARPGIGAGDLVLVHGRAWNGTGRPLRVTWDGRSRDLEPGECWVRRDLSHRVGTGDLSAGRVRFATEIATPAARARPVLEVPARAAGR